MKSNIEQYDYSCVSRKNPRIDNCLMQSKVPEEQFQLLIEMSSINSEKVIGALYDYFVLGYTRREACDRNGVSAGYFSISLKRLLRLSGFAYLLAPYYFITSPS